MPDPARFALGTRVRSIRNVAVPNGTTGLLTLAGSPGPYVAEDGEGMIVVQMAVDLASAITLRRIIDGPVNIDMTVAEGPTVADEIIRFRHMLVPGDTYELFLPAAAGETLRELVIHYVPIYVVN